MNANVAHFSALASNALYPGIELGLKRLAEEKEVLNRRMADAVKSFSERAEERKNWIDGGIEGESLNDRLLTMACENNTRRIKLFVAAMACSKLSLELDLDFEFAGELLALVEESKKLAKK